MTASGRNFDPETSGVFHLMGVDRNPVKVSPSEGSNRILRLYWMSNGQR